MWVFSNDASKWHQASPSNDEYKQQEGGFITQAIPLKKQRELKENVNQIDQYGNTALHIAAEKGFRGVCKVNMTYR